MSKSWKVWEKKVATDLDLVRVVKEHYGQIAPDVVQVADTSKLITYFWTEVRTYGVGPLIGECKSRNHKAIPAYLFKVLDDSSVQTLYRKQPVWVANFTLLVKALQLTNQDVERLRN